jgi:hypothetical protein
MTIDPALLPPTEPSIARDAYWFTGFDDGKVGQTWLEHECILRADAEREKAAEIAACEQRLERAKADSEIAKDAFEREHKDYTDLATRLRNATEDRDKSPTQYSRSMSAIFCAFSVAILAADFPLALAISTEILYQDSGADPMFVAAGIVAMGLFFKIIADPFMRPRYLLHPVLRPFTWGVTAIFAVVIALALATVLGLLGIFRGGSAGNQRMQPTDITYASPTNPPPSSPTPSASGPTEPASGIVGTVQRAFGALEMGFIAKVAFLALALVLPILGGIFASTGTARWHNDQQLKRLQARQGERQTAYETIVRRIHEQKAIVQTAERELVATQQRPTLANNRYHTYLHGYERGLCDTAAVDGHISDAVLAFVRRWLSIARQKENLLRTEAIARANATEASEPATPQS